MGSYRLLAQHQQSQQPAGCHGFALSAGPVSQRHQQSRRLPWAPMEAGLVLPETAAGSSLQQMTMPKAAPITCRPPACRYSCRPTTSGDLPPDSKCSGWPPKAPKWLLSAGWRWIPVVLGQTPAGHATACSWQGWPDRSGEPKPRPPPADPYSATGSAAM